MKSLNVLVNTTLFTTVLLTGTLLQAQEYDNSANIGVGVVDYLFDSKHLQDDAVGAAFNAEFPLAGRWSVAADYIRANSDVENSNVESDLDFYRVGANYHFNLIKGWQPYLGLGLGKLEIEPDVFGPSDILETTIDVGIGVKRRLSDNWLLRGDYKLIYGDQSAAKDSAITFGIAYAFGRRSSPAPAAARPAQPSPTPAVADSDNDGVPDNRDACANTPNGARVDQRGCELDSDRDGVVDSRDNCPDTPRDLMVDANGCPVLDVTQRRQELLVNFDFDKSDVKPEYDGEIAEFADFMEVYGNTNVVIEGHTDSRGTEEYNQRLSERRANAVKNELVNEHEIDAGRISTVGYGETRPVASNDTDEGRARNRRIEAVISVDVEEQRRR